MGGERERERDQGGTMGDKWGVEGHKERGEEGEERGIWRERGDDRGIGGVRSEREMCWNY
jgi:hypothetical protein